MLGVIIWKGLPGLEKMLPEMKKGDRGRRL